MGTIDRYLKPLEAFTGELGRQLAEARALDSSIARATVKELVNIESGLGHILDIVRGIRHPPEDLVAAFQLKCDEGRGATDKALKLLNKGEDPKRSLLAANTAVGWMLRFAQEHAGD